MAGEAGAVGDSFAAVSDDVSTSEAEMLALPPPPPSPAALRCEGGGNSDDVSASAVCGRTPPPPPFPPPQGEGGSLAGKAGAVGVWSMVMADGSPSLFDEPEAPASTERLPPSQDAPASAAGLEQLARSARKGWGGGNVAVDSADDVSGMLLASFKKEATLLVLLPSPQPSPTGRGSCSVGGGSLAEEAGAVGDSSAVVSDDVSTSEAGMRALPPPHPSPAALRCGGGGNSDDVSASTKETTLLFLLPSPQPSPTGRGGRTAEEAGAVGVWSMVMADGSLSLFGEPKAPSSTERLPPPVGDWDSSRVVRESCGGVTGGTLVSVSSVVS